MFFLPKICKDLNVTPVFLPNFDFKAKGTKRQSSDAQLNNLENPKRRLRET